jgi:hypothetical protein
MEGAVFTGAYQQGAVAGLQGGLEATDNFFFHVRELIRVIGKVLFKRLASCSRVILVELLFQAASASLLALKSLMPWVMVINAPR